ncbi:MAG TPA: BatA domain-containing protein [Vicinamibacterales bacterium]|nr:BatA domain-containing protein [Vicinamibacterales bacterium]
MIGWLQPSGLWGLALLAIPIAIHLLRTRRARRLAFPTIRFVPPSRAAAVRLRAPSDLMLLGVRTAIVALAVLAAAQPIWLSSTRLAGWNGRVARAIVVDTSESMRRPRADGRTAAEDAAAAAGAELRVGLTWRIEHPDLGEGTRRAAAWLRSAPPARREIVVISDFQQGSVSKDVLDRVAADVGLRFSPVQGVSERRSIEGVPLLIAPGTNARSQQVELSSQGTQVSLAARGFSSAVQESAGYSGLRLVHDGTQRESERLLATLAAAGTAAPDAAQPIALRFTPVSDAARLGPVSARWMIDAVSRLEQSVELGRLGRHVDALPLPASDSAVVLIRDGAGRPLVRAATLDRELVLDVAAPITSYFSAALARTALSARRGTPGRPEEEVLRISDSDLSSWARVPAPVGPSAWRQAERSDARWVWGAALVLLVVEQWLRSSSRSRKDEKRVAA